MVRLPRTSEASAVGVGGLPRVGFGNATHLPSAATLQREALALARERGARRQVAQLTKLEQLGLGISFDAFVSGWQCGRHYRVHTTMRSCAHGFYCHAHLPGVWHRATSSVTFRAAVQAGLQSSGWLAEHTRHVAKGGGARPGSGSMGDGGGLMASGGGLLEGGGERPLRAVWHVRTGDARSGVSEASLLWLNRSVLSAQLPHRPVEHLVLTSDLVMLRAEWPRLAPFCRASSSVEADLATMLTADILVTGGSSFGLAAAALAPVGQLHLFLPPKEAYYAGTPSNGQLRGMSAFQSYFMPRNTVPLGHDARPFPEYQPKLRAMLGALDRGRRPTADEAWLHAGEPWLWDEAQRN